MPEDDRKVLGAPRIDYPRTYVLLPPTANASWAAAVVEACWDDHRYTLGGSADDAGIGDLSRRRIIAVNPGHWGSDDGLKLFLEEHYAGVLLACIDADSPEDLVHKLKLFDTGILWKVGDLPVNTNSPWYPWKTRSMSDITHVFVHHSAGVSSSDFAVVREIAEFHTSADGKNRPGICYSFVIGEDGTIWQTAWLTHVIFAQGTTAEPGDENFYGLAVCLLGTRTYSEPTVD